MSFVNCDTSGSAPVLTDLRIAPLLTLWITGTLGAAFPILAHSSGATHIPRTIFEYVFTTRCHFGSYKLAQLNQIFWLWCDHLYSVYPPPRPRYQQAHLTMSWSRMEKLCTHFTHLACFDNSDHNLDFLM